VVLRTGNAWNISTNRVAKLLAQQDAATKVDTALKLK
jgi:hypothetical protein